MPPASPPEPPRIARLPHREPDGRPIPWFAYCPRDGEPDFRVVRPGAVGIALSAGICWVCGTLFDALEPRHFVIGPMCVVNRNTGEPPAHVECARYSVQACPFLSRPNMHRRDSGLPEGTHTAQGYIPRNPGVAAIYITEAGDYQPYKVGHDLLIRLGQPKAVRWWALGRAATRAEVLASFESGLPALRQIAEAEGQDALDSLEGLEAAALRLVPA